MFRTFVHRDVYVSSLQDTAELSRGNNARRETVRHEVLQHGGFVMKHTTEVAKHQLKPTVHIDAVPELARERERFKEGERVPETNGDELPRDGGAIR